MLALAVACGGSDDQKSGSSLNITSSENDVTVQDVVSESITISKTQGNVIFNKDVSIPNDVLVIVESSSFQVAGNLNLIGELQIK